MNAMHKDDLFAKAVDDAMKELADAAEAGGAVADAPKGKRKRPGKAVVETADEAKAKTAEAKPVAAMLDGFELAIGADPVAVALASSEASNAADMILRKDADLLSAYLTLGGFASEVAPAFKSTKVFGQYLAKAVPASQALDPALRSNCKWLWEALNLGDHEAADLLLILGINRIEDFKSQNPTVIRREYNAAKATKTKAEAADADGMTVEEAEAKAKVDAKANAEALKAAFDNAIAALVQEASGKKTKEDAAKHIAETLSTSILSHTKQADILHHIVSLAE